MQHLVKVEQVSNCLATYKAGRSVRVSACLEFLAACFDEGLQLLDEVTLPDARWPSYQTPSNAMSTRATLSAHSSAPL